MILGHIVDLNLHPSDQNIGGLVQDKLVDVVSTPGSNGYLV